MQPGEEFYDAKVKVLGEYIKHHVKEEEQPGGIFAQAKRGDEDLDAMGEQLKARKQELMARAGRRQGELTRQRFQGRKPARRQGRTHQSRWASARASARSRASSRSAQSAKQVAPEPDIRASRVSRLGVQRRQHLADGGREADGRRLQVVARPGQEVGERLRRLAAGPARAADRPCPARRRRRRRDRPRRSARRRAG